MGKQIVVCMDMEQAEALRDTLLKALLQGKVSARRRGELAVICGDVVRQMKEETVNV